jgi:hypothetical protein
MSMIGAQAMPETDIKGTAIDSDDIAERVRERYAAAEAGAAMP